MNRTALLLLTLTTALGWRVPIWAADEVDGACETTILRLVYPTDGATVSLLTDRQKAYLALPDGQRTAGFDDDVARAKIATIGWKPEPVQFVWAGVRWPAHPATLEIVRASDGRAVRTLDVSIRTRNVWAVSNLETGKEYAWRVKAEGMVSPWWRFRTASGPRLLEVDGVPNFRDLGGAVGLGGRRVRQGLLYRSAGANRNAATNEVPGATRITEAGRKEVERLGIRTDLDLRRDFECKGMTGSPFGKSVRWVPVPYGAYLRVDEEKYRQAFVRCFRTVNDSQNLPLVFHCIAGQDRTGTLAFILNALLGVGERDLSQDWEMTAFWNPATGWFSHEKRYKAMLAYFNEKYPGRTLSEKVEQYVLSCGIADEEIKRFRERMLERERAGRDVRP